MGVVIVGSILLIGGLGVMGNILNNTAWTDCDRSTSDRLGWAELKVGRMSTIGQSHTLKADTPVLEERSKPETLVCTLPRGTRIDVRERPDRGRHGTWLVVHGDAIQLPR